MTTVQATRVSHVPLVTGSLTLLRFLLHPVTVLHETPEKLIRSSCASFFKYKRPLVTVGTDARYIVVSAGEIGFATVVLLPLSKAMFDRLNVNPSILFYPLPLTGMV